MEITILIADDDPYIRQVLSDMIAKEGYNTVVAADGGEAIDVFYETKGIDLIILDVMMPVCTGWEVLKEIREVSDIPIMMLTALGDESHEIQGLTHGADEYVAKPFSYELLRARLNALLRKVIKGQNETLEIEGLLIDKKARGVLVEGKDSELNRKEYELLMYLIDNQNVILKREQIFDKIWGYDFEGDPRTLNTHIKTLRQKLGKYSTYIVTSRGTGYMFKVGD